MELFKISILCRDGTSAGSFQMIQALVDCDLAEPGFFVGTVKTGEIFVGGNSPPEGVLLPARSCPSLRKVLRKSDGSGH